MATLKKYVFMAPEVLFLGYVVSGDGLRVDESKIEAIRNWPRQQTIIEVKEIVRGLGQFLIASILDSSTLKPSP